MNTSLYLASSFSRQSEMREIAEDLASMGVSVTSRWLNEEFALSKEVSDRFRRECALVDLEDVDRAQMLVLFADDLGFPLVYSHLATGARHVEMGWALAKGKPVIIVGTPQNTFHWLPQVVHLKDVDELFEYLGGE